MMQTSSTVPTLQTIQKSNCVGSDNMKGRSNLDQYIYNVKYGACSQYNYRFDF
jgi:hypothetical protein